MMEAAAKGELTIRDPQTDLPYRPAKISDYWDLVTPTDVNAWLNSQGAQYRWKVLTALEAKDVFSKFDPLQHRYDDERSNNEYILAWWDETLKASMWWELKSISPKEAAMLLCGLNPGDPAANGQTLATEGEPDADDYRILVRRFNDAALDGEARTLNQWLDLANGRRLKHHSWIDEWIKASPPSAKTNIVDSPPVQPVQRATAHEANVLATLRQLGFDPKRLPKAPAGKASPAKRAAKAALPQMTPEIFRKAWQRLRNAGELGEI